MAKATEEKALANVESYPLVQATSGALREVVESNLGDDEITEFDLPRLKFPSGSVPAFVMPTEEGDEATKEVVGVIIGQGMRRAFWEKKYGQGEAGPPQCSAMDGRTGVGNPGGVCRLCPKAQFGTATNDDGSSGRGQACQQRKVLFLALPDQSLPVVISVPPTSLKALKKYLMTLTAGSKPFWGVVTKISLTKTKNAGGTEYAQAVFTKVADLDEDTASKMKEIAASFGDVFSRTGITAEEAGVSASDAPASGSGDRPSDKPPTD